MAFLLLFEDAVENQEFISKGISHHSRDAIPVEVFSGDTDVPTGLTYEQFIERQYLERSADIGLIVCDQELGLYSKLPGLSANAVGVVARNLGIPFCQYSQHPKANQREINRFRKLQRWNAEEITLTEARNDWAREISELWNGFEQLRAGYKDTNVNTLKPAAALAKLMGRSDATSRIALYGSGDQAVMTEIFGFVDSSSQVQRMPRILGMWLRLSLLRFHGLLVNGTAAASYLNISVADFDRVEVRKEFASAKYDGPFGGLSEWWWRSDLESQLLEAEKGDGRSMLHGRGVEVAECLDAESGERAGYYCMITESPVSRSNSKGNINWFPSGADLARIRSSKFDEITSLVSM
ncbi:MAG: hypothetical protein SGJ20_19940 [Planctomycetota bacterium]|nr:hypothetical protein [Planctomycetota bacterium]